MSGVTSVFTSKMSDEDELLLLSAAASAATIALAACIVKRRRKRAERFWMRPLFQRRHERGAYNTLMAELYDIMDLEGDATYHQIESRRI